MKTKDDIKIRLTEIETYINHVNDDPYSGLYMSKFDKEYYNQLISEKSTLMWVLDET